MNLNDFPYGQIGVINSSIASGWNYYGIIDNRGYLYMAGHNYFGVLGVGTKRAFRKNPRKVNLKSKVVSVTAGSYNDRRSHTIGVVTEDGEVYFWGTTDTIVKPRKLDFPRPGKIVKFVFENASFNKGIIMDNGLAYLLIYKEIFLIPAAAKTKIVDLVIPLSGFYHTKVSCFFLDNYGNVFLFRVTDENKNIMIKLDLPDPIKQLSISNNDGYAGLSIKGEVYTWGYTLRGTIPKREDLISSFIAGEIASGDTFNIFKADIPASVVSISSGIDNIAAVTNKGTVYVWGFNYSNRLVNKDEEEKLLTSGAKMIETYREIDDHKPLFIELPLELKLKSKIESISLGGTFTIALTEDGVINYWGDRDMAPKNTI